MARRFIVRPLAEADLESAARWYDDEQPPGSPLDFSVMSIAPSSASAIGHSSFPRSPAMCAERSASLAIG
jgi:hypothetical protein